MSEEEKEEKPRKRSFCFFNPENGNSVMIPRSVLEDEGKKEVVKAMIGMTGNEELPISNCRSPIEE